MTIDILFSEGEGRALYGPRADDNIQPWFVCCQCKKEWIPGTGSDPERKLCGLCYAWTERPMQS